jgi:hypothetical protein
METTLNTPTTVGDETLSNDAYQRLLPELQALEPDELMQVNLEISSAVSTVLGVLPGLRGLRPDIEKSLPDFDLGTFDKLEAYTLALAHANMQYQIATAPPDDLQPVASEGTSLRSALYADVTALAQRGFVDTNKLKDLKGPNGYKNLAGDLLILAGILRENWPKFAGKCATDPTEIERATKLGQHLLRVLGLREQAPILIADATEQRVRAFTLFREAYDQARRAATYLRWNQDDADKIAPSLYAGRSNGRRKAGDADSQTPATDAAHTAPAQTSSAASSANSPTTGQTPAPNQPSPTVASSAKPAVGMPGSDPFLG